MARPLNRLSAGVTLALALSAPAAAQEGWNRYEQLYGQPVDVTIADLVQGAGYEGRAVRTRGDLELDYQSQVRVFRLRDSFGNRIAIVPVQELSGLWESEAMKLLGREVQITGVVQRANLSAITGNQPAVVVQFWRYLGPPESPPKDLSAAPVATLEDLVMNVGRNDGRVVRVVGKFRGKNLYGDLPSRSRLDSDDWVIKDDVFAAWVTGRKPKGDGWALDASMRRDTNKWIAVTGRVESRRGITYLKALKLELVPEPATAVEPKAAPTPTPPPPVPPVIVFSLPLDHEQDISPNSVFQVQFSKDMDEKSFAGHVALRYRGGLRPGDRPFDAVRLSYDGGRRALTVDPGDVLRPGREVELLLLPGIVDLEGLELAPRDAAPEDGILDELRFRVAF